MLNNTPILFNNRKFEVPSVFRCQVSCVIIDTVWGGVSDFEQVNLEEGPANTNTESQSIQAGTILPT